MRALRGATLALALLASPGPAAAGSPPAAAPASPEGRPRVVLDHVELPGSLPRAGYFEQRLREILQRETRRVVWGAGRESTITYRFFVTELSIEVQGDVVRVRCHATGQLPKGKTAKGTLTFSGEASRRDAVVVQVLEIVARGVIARLAELERSRRGQPG